MGPSAHPRLAFVSSPSGGGFVGSRLPAVAAFSSNGSPVYDSALTSVACAASALERIQTIIRRHHAFFRFIAAAIASFLIVGGSRSPVQSAPAKAFQTDVPEFVRQSRPDMVGAWGIRDVGMLLPA